MFFRPVRAINASPMLLLPRNSPPVRLASSGRRRASHDPTSPTSSSGSSSGPGSSSDADSSTKPWLKTGYTTPTPKTTPSSSSPSMASSRTVPSSSSSSSSKGSSSSGDRPEYRSVAWRVTLAMVAAPIALVTSYFMFQRVVLGHDKRKGLGGKQTMTTSKVEETDQRITEKGLGRKAEEG